MASPYTLIVDKPASRLDVWLHGQIPGQSRSRLQRLIREGHVRLNDHPCLPRADLHAGDRVEVILPDPAPMGLVPEAMTLNILLEDRHLLVLNKPPGLVVHPGAGRRTHTLVHALLHHCCGQLSGIGGVERPGIVHRLDKDTSGCLVVAKSDGVHRSLSAAFQSREVEKVYLALVRGRPRFLSGKVDQPMGRHPVQRRKMAIVQGGKSAWTEWRIRETFPAVSLLECRIHSGRTHQIRVHLASIGHPVLGDALYGKAAGAFPRQMLHAWKLAFQHPVTGRKVSCEAPVPADMEAVLQSCLRMETP